MDFSESTKLVYNRIQTLEPGNVSKIIGYLLLQDNGDRDMIRLAFGPDSLIISLINRAKTELGLSEPNRTQFLIDSLSPVPAGPRMFQPGSHPHWDNADSAPEIFPVKICHYFNKGFCKHGNNCKYFHGRRAPESLLLPHNGQFFFNEDQQVLRSVSPRSLERLEVEITELLRSRRGVPVSIASLPMMYYEKYGRSLQAEGYLTESQRHGKTGFSLTKLLARLSNSIRLIDRPHGQHSVILVEDVGRYLEYNCGERNDSNGSVSGSRQIYLTFPAESTFSELDVSNYFNKFGPVQDVRIPCQQKRMFGFVTFVYSETVRLILSKGNPHFVCDARVLVKPYREKSRLFERKISDKMLHRICPHFIEEDLEFTSLSPRTPDKSRFRKLENDQAFEFERRCFSEMNLTSKNLSPRPYFNYSMDELKLPNDNNNSNNNNFSIDDAEEEERFNYLLDVLNNASTSDDQNITTNQNDQDSGLNLPENPFASTVGNNGISTFT